MVSAGLGLRVGAAGVVGFGLAGRGFRIVTGGTRGAFGPAAGPACRVRRRNLPEVQDVEAVGKTTSILN